MEEHYSVASSSKKRQLMLSNWPLQLCSGSKVPPPRCSISRRASFETAAISKLSNTLFVFVLDDTAKHNLNGLLLAAEGKWGDRPLTNAYTSKHNSLQILNINFAQHQCGIF